MVVDSVRLPSQSPRVSSYQVYAVDVVHPSVYLPFATFLSKMPDSVLLEKGTGLDNRNNPFPSLLLEEAVVQRVVTVAG